MQTDNFSLYGLDLSYFTGKIEAYLRYKGLGYQLTPATSRTMADVVWPATGLLKMPAVRTPEGQWLTDSTPIMAWLDARYPAGAVTTGRPGIDFLLRLLEDFADEWLWRPALHYRWSYAIDAHLMGTRIAREVVDDLRLPLWVKTRLVIERQRRVYVRGDGVTSANHAAVEAIYLRTLAHLETIFTRRSYMFGDRPSAADFGFFASMFRHFSLDPTPSAIMRQRAPAVYAWVARLWNARLDRCGPFLDDERAPDDWRPLLAEACRAYLPYLQANAVAFGAGRRDFDANIDGVSYRKLPVSQYRVWCLEQLQAAFLDLPPAGRAQVSADLASPSAIIALTTPPDRPSAFDPDGRAPLGQPKAADRTKTARWSATGAAAWGRPDLRP